MTVTGASPRRDQSLRGHTAEAAEGFPRHYPPAIVSSLVETTGLGFAVMSGSSHGITPVQGKPNLPDKEFRYLRHFVTRNTVYVEYFDISRSAGQDISAWLPMSP